MNEGSGATVLLWHCVSALFDRHDGTRHWLIVLERERRSDSMQDDGESYEPCIGLPSDAMLESIGAPTDDVDRQSKVFSGIDSKVWITSRSHTHVEETVAEFCLVRD